MGKPSSKSGTKYIIAGIALYNIGNSLDSAHPTRIPSGRSGLASLLGEVEAPDPSGTSSSAPGPGEAMANAGTIYSPG